MTKSKGQSETRRKPLVTVIENVKTRLYEVELGETLPKGMMNKVMKAIWHEWSAQKYYRLRKQSIDNSKVKQ